MAKKTKKKIKARRERRERGKRRATPSELAAALSACTLHRPARLATLASQLSQVAASRQQAVDARRQSRVIKWATHIINTQGQQQVPEQVPQPVEQQPGEIEGLDAAMDRRAMADRAHVAVSLILANFPPAWADALSTTSTPLQVMEALERALRRPT